jgi:hypothetical protein
MAKERHLEMDELLGLRDGEGSAYARGHLESCEARRSELRALPTFGPPRELWPRIRRHVWRRRVRRRLSYGAVGLAAAAAFAGFMVLRGPDLEPADAWVAEATSEDLGPMINRARQLETLLQVYSPQRRVYNAPTALAASALEDRIVVLDQLLLETRAGAGRRAGSATRSLGRTGAGTRATGQPAGRAGGERGVAVIGFKV